MAIHFNLNHLKRILTGALPGVLIAFPPALYAGQDSIMASDSATQVLQKMSLAADALDYSGEFVYVKGGKISSMQISHMKATESSASQQKLMALDGSMREIILQGDEVACVLPDEGIGLREKQQSRQPFKLNISDTVEDLDRYYQMQRAGDSRVASRNCELLNVTPKDQFRYGYRLCIDRENALLLQSELTDLNGQLLESYMFVNIEFGNTHSSQLASQTPPKQLTWMGDSEVLAHDNKPVDEINQKWQVKDNQSGFELDQYIERLSPLMNADVIHLVLGDGLARVSVFVAPAGASANKDNKSITMGSLNSYTLKLDGYLITAIGEVPRETVQMIAGATLPR